MKTTLVLIVLNLWTLSSQALTVLPADIAGKSSLITVKDVTLKGEAKKVLADIKGISIYTFDMDSTNTSVCSGGCLTVWPALEVPAGAVVLPPYSTITGNNGKPQLTLNGLPLYYFNKDKTPADILGHYPSWQLVIVE